MAVIESDNINIRLLCDTTLRNTLRSPCTRDLPSKMLIGSTRLHLPLDTTDQIPSSTSAGTAGTERVWMDGSASERSNCDSTAGAEAGASKRSKLLLAALVVELGIEDPGRSWAAGAPGPAPDRGWG